MSSSYDSRKEKAAGVSFLYSFPLLLSDGSFKATTLSSLNYRQCDSFICPLDRESLISRFWYQHVSAHGSLISVRKYKLYYLHWLGLALYPVLVLAAPLSGRGAVPPVPAALPLLVFLTSDRRSRQSQPCTCKITDINCAWIISNPPRKHKKRH